MTTMTETECTYTDEQRAEWEAMMAPSAADLRRAERRRCAEAYRDDPTRAGLPRIELVCSVERVARVTVGLHVELLGAGAREAIAAGLATTDRGDDASTLIYRTGRTVGDAARARRAAMTPGQLAVYGDSYPPDDDDRPEVQRLDWASCWYADRDTPESYLSRVLAHVAGRIVRAGLR